MVARRNKSERFSGERNGGEFLTVEGVDGNPVGEWFDRDLEPVRESVVHEITLSP